MTSADERFLPYARQTIDKADIAAVADVLGSDFLTTGPMVEKFEGALAETVGSRHAVACSSGTAALHLAALALGVGPGDRVVVPAVTFLATANAVRYVGGEVVFADINPETGQMEGGQLSAALATADGAKARVIFPVCLTGATADPSALENAAAGREVAYDACHALGTSYISGNQRGTVGDCRHSALATFSFHPVKTIALGEGGAVTTNDDILAERLQKYRNHGMTRDAAQFVNTDMAFDGEGEANPWYYEMSEPGFNYRLTDIQCALGLSQISKLDAFSTRRRALAARYVERMAPLAPLVRPLAVPPGCEPVLHLFVALIDFSALKTERAQVMKKLRSQGIGTQVHYIPVHKQPYYRDRYGDLDLPGAEAYYARTLSLPLFAGMTEDDVDRVVATLADTLGLAKEI
ncbi:MAG: UDP-4-amino-4,6-dideoxy-N-acetyl-beta-L-altrosamine transaminase [Euryarchaeota archaeon]|nr:UDP-4-amino-4,6-dideoxy-N-acetyl-beta-L-altrosamine transaminase [Euryarchaeota archaeon]